MRDTLTSTTPSARAGKPLVKVVPLDAPAAGQVRRLGFLAGQITVPEDFDRMGSTEIGRLFSDGDTAWSCCWTPMCCYERPPGLSGWAAARAERLSAAASALLDDPGNALLCSAASPWEVAIKRGLGWEDVRVDPRLLRRGLLDNGYRELPVTGDHAVVVDGPPPIHKDPFDRILVAQSLVEGVTLVTADPLVARYPVPVRLI